MDKRIKYSKFKSFINFFKNKKPSPSGLIITFGSRGVGKSTDIAKDWLQFLKKDSKKYKYFYTNIDIITDDPRYKKLNLTKFKLTDYLPINEKTNNANCWTRKTNKNGSYEFTPFEIEENSIIELDELGIIAHARDFKSFPLEFTRFIKYLRKMGILMKANSQSYDIDKTIREGASELRLKKKILFWSYSRKILKKIVVAKKEEGKNISAEEQIHDELTFAPIIMKNAIKVTFIPFYTDLFESFK